MTTPIVLGVDPGSRFCGLALVRGRDDLVAWDLLDRSKCLKGQDVRVWVERCRTAAWEVFHEAEWGVDPDPIVAVEAVVTPQTHINGRRRLNSPESLIGTAAVMGGIVAWAASEGFPCVLVPPGRNGEGPKAAYPAELWGVREGPAGTGKLNHVRSAWDCALAGPGLRRQAGAKVRP